MRKEIRKIFIYAVIAILPAAISCQQDDTLKYNNITMGNFKDGAFISDQGNTFNVVELNCTDKIDTMKRAVVVCDVLNKTEGEDYSYDIRLNKAHPVLTKAPLVMSTITDEDAMVTDPVHIKELWYSGGYLNMYIVIPIPASDSNPHLINLVVNDAESSGNSYTLELRHNGFGEVWTEESVDYILAGTYVSFPVSKVFAGNSAEVTLNWKWHKAVGNAWTLEVVDNQIKFNWERNSFEQTPLNLASKAATDIM